MHMHVYIECETMQLRVTCVWLLVWLW